MRSHLLPSVTLVGVCFLAACAADRSADTGSSARVTSRETEALDHPCSGEADEHDKEIDDEGAAEAAAGKRVDWDDGVEHDAPVPVKILALNDFHGQITLTKKFNKRRAGGAAVLASYLRAAEAGVEDHTIITHAGDFVGASVPESGLLADEPALMFANLFANEHCRYLGSRDDDDDHGGARSHEFDGWIHGHQRHCNMVGTLGNHEFDKGKAELLRKLYGGNAAGGPYLESPWRGVKFPYVSANVIDQETGIPLLPPYEIKEINGARVAFIGAVTSLTPTIVTPDGVKGFTFQDEATAINRAVRLLHWQGVHAIVVLIHEGGVQSFDTSTLTGSGAVSGRIVDIVKNLDDDVDVVLSGHSHQFTNALLPTASGKQVLVTQAFSYSQAFANVDLMIDRDSDEVVSKSATITVAYADAGPGLSPDPAAATLVAQASAWVAPIVSQVLGSTDVDLIAAMNAGGESNLGDLIADAQRGSMGADFAFMNIGGIRADVPKGSITWGQLYAVQPFANTLIEVDLTGAQVWTALEEGVSQATWRPLQISGLTFTYDRTRPAGSRVTGVFRAGAPLARDGAIYKVVMNSFLSTGGDGFTVLASGTNRVVGPVDLDALVTFVKAKASPITQGYEGRVAPSP